MTETLKTLIDELTVPHPRTFEGTTGTEDALLDQLKAAVGSNVGRGSGGGQSSGAVIDAHALDVLNSIWRDVVHSSPVLHSGAGLPGAVRRWHAEVTRWDATEHATLELLSLAMTWRTEIREILEPVKRIPMRGQVCPGCTHDYHQNDAGEWSPTITLHAEAIPVADCAVCGEKWTGGQLLDLRAGKLASAVG